MILTKRPVPVEAASVCIGGHVDLPGIAKLEANASAVSGFRR